MRRLIVALAAAAVAACSMPVDRKPAEDAVHKFHGLLDAGQFETIYTASGDDLKATSPRHEFVALLTEVHRKLGPTTLFRQKRWTIDYGMSNAMLTLDYATRYAAGEASERFVYLMHGEKAVLVDYQIRSSALEMQ